jgi:cytochrome c
MSAFEWNKVIGGILVALLVIKVADIAGDSLLHAKVPASKAYPVAGVTPAKPSTTAPAKAEIKLAAVGPMLASASADAGAKVARKCAVCHSFDKGGPNKVGPGLWGVVGNKVGSHAGYSYSSALKGKGGNWDYEALNKFLYNPKADVPGTRMGFAGIKNDAERTALIAYMRSRADNPAPLP